MSSSLGEFLICLGAGGLPPAAMAALQDTAVWPAWRGAPAQVVFETPAPGLALWRRGEPRIVADASGGGLALALEPGAAGAAAAQAVLGRWMRERRWSGEGLRGRYCHVLWDARERRLVACVDAFRTCPLYYAQAGGCLLVASDLRLILATGLVAREVSLPALYHYLNFSYVPAPFCAIEGVAKLPAGHCLEGTPERVSVSRHWDAEYPADLGGDEAARAAALRERMIATVTAYRPPSAQGWGTFLSGGTDSSSIAGILSRSAGAPVRSFSIGFAEAGYDELGYSRIASRHFGLEAHERLVGERDAVDLVPRLAEAFDEPFGNSSAIPTFHCADLAQQHGVGLLVAGDGGDEIFGGNERYRKDRIFEAYHRAPAPARMAGAALAGLLRGVDARWANRIKNFVHRGSLPNPDRFYSDDSFASDAFEELLGERFRAAVGRDDSLDVQRAIHAAARTDEGLHRLMYLDLKMTIADNDVIKVVRASRLAGVQVVFPYLDRELVDYTGRLPAHDKVRGLNKRHLFKLATEDILPEEIRRKKKQGFGLPVSVWLRRAGPFRELAHEVLLSPRAAQRGYFRPEYVQHLMRRHERGAWDHAAEIYLLMMLELWHRRHVDMPSGAPSGAAAEPRAEALHHA